MPYVGGSVASLFGPVAQAATATAARRMAYKGGRRMVQVTTINTPVESGHLRQSWRVVPVTKSLRRGVPSYESGVETDVSYAPYVEHGTGLFGPKHSKYVIRPKKPGGVLHWIGPGGEHVFAREVHHPGSPGNHMVAIAAEVVEHEMDGELMKDVLDDWVREVEASAD